MNVGQMEEYMSVRYRPMGNDDPSAHAHMSNAVAAGVKRSAEEAGMQHHQPHQQQYICDANGMKQSPMMAGQTVVSNSPVGASGVNQVQDPQPSTSHPGDGQKSGLPNGKKTKGRVKIKMEFIDNKLRRYTTFSKRKTGIMKKAYELSTLTGTQVMLLVASETGHVYTFATRKLQPMITSDTGKDLIQMCLNSPDPPPSDPRSQASDPRGQPSGFEETDLSYSVDDEKVRAPASMIFGNPGLLSGPHSSPVAQMAPPPSPHHHPHHHHHPYSIPHHGVHPGMGHVHGHHHVPVHHQHMHSPTQHQQAQYSPQVPVHVPVPGMVMSPQNPNPIHIHNSPSSTPSPSSMHMLSQQHHIPCPSGSSLGQSGAQSHLDA